MYLAGREREEDRLPLLVPPIIFCLYLTTKLVRLHSDQFCFTRWCGRRWYSLSAIGMTASQDKRSYWVEDSPYTPQLRAVLFYFSSIFPHSIYLYVKQGWKIYYILDIPIIIQYTNFIALKVTHVNHYCVFAFEILYPSFLTAEKLH